MSAVLALPAAVRLPRTVVVRRALLSGLFLIGFVVLAVAFGGGTAHAADAGTATDTGFETATASSPSGMPGTTTSTSSTSTSPAESATSDPDANSATTDGDSPFDGSDAALEREAAEREARAAQQAGARLSGGAQETGERLGKAVQPLTDRLRPVTDPVTAPVDQVVQDVQHATGLPIHLSGVSAEQGRDGERPRHGDARNGGREHAAVADRCGTDRIADDRPTAPVDTTGGPDRTAARVAADGAGDAPGRGGLPGHLPQGPVAPAPHLTGDGNGPRGGDQHAVLPGTDPRFGLVPGGVRAASGAPTRERSTDILEFPG